MRGTRRGHFEFSTMFILYLCTQLGNEFLVTFYTPRNSNASEKHILSKNDVSLKSYDAMFL